MTASVLRPLVMLCGLLAMLFCLSTPAAAEPSHFMGNTQPTAGMASDMPCCPEKSPAAPKSCSAQCTLIAPARYELAYVPLVKDVRFIFIEAVGSGMTYAPVAPPPR